MRARTLRPSRRRVLKAAVTVAGAALIARAPNSTAQPKATLKKRTKEAVGYRDEPYQGRTCAKCVLYAGNGECVLVEGEVSPNGWCLQWTPATMGRLRQHSTV
jgi:high potential iron-sulfur protein